MANFKPCVRNQRKDGLYTVYIRITHNRQVAYIKTNKLVRQDGLDRKGDICDSFVLRSCYNLIDGYSATLNELDLRNLSAAELKTCLECKGITLSFGEFASQYIDGMIDRGQIRTANIYRAAVKCLMNYCHGDVKFDFLTHAVLKRWIDSLDGTKRARSLYPVCIRQIFKEAFLRMSDPAESLPRLAVNPWTRIVIPGNTSSNKRAIPAEECRRFFSWACPEGKGYARMRLGRDVALMSFCLAGMNTVDILRLKKSDYDGEVIRYRRAKTRSRRSDGAYFEIRVPEMVRDVVARYLAKDESEYLFRFAERYADDKTFNTVVNAGIKLICDLIGSERYSVYTFRHSWATIAQNDMEASFAEVGLALNHSGGHKVTKGYVKFDFSPVWRLNERVLDFVFFSDRESKLHIRENSHKQAEEEAFALSAGNLIKACAFFQGRCVASFEDIGYNDIEDVTAALVARLPGDIPYRAMVQFKIVNLDRGGKVYACEYQKEG